MARGRAAVTDEMPVDVISGFLVSKAGKLYGPFDTANDATDWMVRNHSDWQAPWHILAIWKASERMQ
jgi:hypothetical protein